MSTDAWRALTTFAVLAAAVTCFAAVSLHAFEIEAGYRLARAQHAARRLARELREAEQAESAARSPSVLRATALALGLDIAYPDRSREVRAEDVQFHRQAVEAEQAVVVKADPR